MSNVELGLDVLGAVPGVGMLARGARGAEAAQDVVASSRVLGQNLERAGFARPADSAAHHIVAGTARQAAEARGVLQRFGIGINEAENGVWLPKNLSVANSTGAYVHSILHTNEYYSSVNELLAQADTRQEAIESLSYIRQQLLGGALP